MMGIDVWLVSE